MDRALAPVAGDGHVAAVDQCRVIAAQQLGRCRKRQILAAVDMDDICVFRQPCKLDRARQWIIAGAGQRQCRGAFAAEREFTIRACHNLDPVAASLEVVHQAGGVAFQSAAARRKAYFDNGERS